MPLKYRPIRVRILQLFSQILQAPIFDRVFINVVVIIVTLYDVYILALYDVYLTIYDTPSKPIY